MAAFDVGTAEPAAIVAGDAVSWRRDDLAASYAPALYDLSYQAVSRAASTERITIAATASGGSFLVALTSAVTTGYAVGDYEWTAFLTRKADGQRAAAGSGLWSVRPNPATVTGDIRTHDERMLAMLESLIEGRATKDVEEYEIGGRKLKKIPMRELRAMRASYARKVANADAAARGVSSRLIRRVSF